MVKDLIKKVRKRPRDTHKGDYGHVLVVAGSIGLAGAASFAFAGIFEDLLGWRSVFWASAACAAVSRMRRRGSACSGIKFRSVPRAVTTKSLPSRRAMIAATSAALILPHRLMAQAASEPFSWDRLIARAQRLARAPFAETPLYPGAQAIDYDALHQARFAEDRTIWGDLPGDTGVRLFPLSRTAAQPVQIALVDKGRATPLREVSRDR